MTSTLKIKTHLLQLICFCVLHFFVNGSLVAQRQKVWVDADTGNETDDIYALARLLADPSIEVVGVSSAHFNNADLVAFEKWNQYATKNINTVQLSQQLNEALLQVMGKLSIAHPLGADRQMGRAWGGRTPRNSDAAQSIIAAVKKISPHEKLTVINLGALTNIASAIALDTAIASRLVCYALGAKYNLRKGYWDKSEFNIRNDLNAFDDLLDNAAVDLVIMPIDVALPYRFRRDDLYAKLNSQLPLEQMLKQRWQDTNPQDTIRTLWDLALVEAVVQPQYATMKKVLTPPENTERFVRIFSEINVAKMEADFYKGIKNKQ